MLQNTLTATTVTLTLFLASQAHAQSDWSNHKFPNGPRGRTQSQAVTTPTRIVCFGGSGDLSNNVVFDDTWEWRTNTWKQLQPKTSPSARAGHAMAYDAARDRVVLFGGQAGKTIFGDTWEFDGTTWARVQTTGPSARSGARMAYDARRKRIVLFGGRTGIPGLNDTWTYDGTSWNQVQTSTSGTPQGRYYHAMAWDAHTERVMIASGFDGFPVFNSTWAFDGRNWTRIPSPRALMLAEACWDQARRRVVVQNADGATYDWDGQQWSARSTKSSPHPLNYASLAYDSSAEQMVLFFGLYNGSNAPQEAWTLKTNALSSATPFGTACRGSTGTPSIHAADTLSWIGESTDFALTGARPKSPAILSIGLSDKLWSTKPLPYDMKPIGASGCFVYHSVEAFELTTTDDKGNAFVRIPVPNDPALAGLSYFAQYYLPDPGANSLGMTTTQAIHSVVGIL